MNQLNMVLLSIAILMASMSEFVKYFNDKDHNFSLKEKIKFLFKKRRK